MNELQFGINVRQALNREMRIDAPSLERLRAARERALERRKAETAGDLSFADNVLGRFGGLGGFSLSVVVPLLLLALGLGSLHSGQKTLRAAEAVETDTRLLADDLPIDAYLDKGFEAWLKKQQGE